MNRWSLALREQTPIALSQLILAMKSAIVKYGGVPLATGVLGAAVLLVEALEAAEKVEIDDLQCKQLAERSALLVLALFETLNESAHPLEPGFFSEAVNSFKRTLLGAVDLTKDVCSRNKLNRFYNQKSIRKRIADVTSRLDASYDAILLKLALAGHKAIVGTQNSALTTHGKLDDLHDAVRATAENVGRLRLDDDDDFILFKNGEITIVRRLDHLRGSWVGTAIARVRGEERLVRVYRKSRRGDPERFIRDVHISRLVRHQFITQVFGYTRGREERYIVHSLDTPTALTLMPMIDYIYTVYQNGGTIRIQNILLMLTDIRKALDFLDQDNIMTAEADIRQSLQESELVVNPDGKIMIGTGGFNNAVTMAQSTEDNCSANSSWDDSISTCVPAIRAKREVEVFWIIGVEFNNIFGRHSQKPGHASAMIKFAHDLLHDGDYDLLHYNWTSAPDFLSIRECRRLISSYEPELCTYWPTDSSKMPAVGDVLYCLEEICENDPYIPVVSPTKNIAAEIGNVAETDNDHSLQGDWDSTALDLLPNGVYR
ncbi:hypothetical protein BD410DRAFT_122992 [Rickenella mellea]|uniref:Protein kinase domain-containing protein n=1 Tax=Rickenella mellea TaxID=50990 RepID=A0A4Y7PII9_9AGAM|nr:hypothetical protein BD410DRAFT_122992 [Rickenella mellea]